jgi:hypothetical protein
MFSGDGVLERKVSAEASAVGEEEAIFKNDFSVGFLKWLEITYVTDKNVFKITCQCIQEGVQTLFEQEIHAVGKSYRIAQEAHIVLLEEGSLLLWGNWPSDCRYCFTVDKINIGALSHPIQKMDIQAQSVVFLSKVSIKNLSVTARQLSSFQAVHAERANIQVENFCNTGNEILASKHLTILAQRIQNQSGGLYSGGKVKIVTEYLENLKGHISGMEGTSVTVGVSLLQDSESEIGLKGAPKIGAWLESHKIHRQNITRLEYGGNTLLKDLGTLAGEEVYLINVMTKGQGRIAGTQVFLESLTDFILPDVKIEAETLQVKAPNFHLENTECAHTVWEIPGVSSFESTRLSRPFLKDSREQAYWEAKERVLKETASAAGYTNFERLIEIYLSNNPHNFLNELYYVLDKRNAYPQRNLREAAIDIGILNFPACHERIRAMTQSAFEARRMIVLTHPYKTRGTFQVQEPTLTLDTIEACMKARFGEVERYSLLVLPFAEYTLHCHAPLQAEGGITFLTPRAKLCLGNESQKQFAEWIALSGNIQAYATEFDVQSGGMAAQNAKLWAPRGVHLGRLKEDQTRRVFATFYAHQYSPSSHNLGNCIVQKRYEFLGKNVGIYDGRHLLTMPVAINNGTFLYTRNGETEIIGALYHKGRLETQTFKLFSPSIPSEVEGGQVVVHGDCTLVGKITVKNYITRFEFNHQVGLWDCRRWESRVTHFCNSDSAQFLVYGKCFGQSVISNQWAHVFIQTQSSAGINHSCTDFTAGLYQQFITNTPAGLEALRNSYYLYAEIRSRELPDPHSARKARYPAGIAHHNNRIFHTWEGLSYAQGFLLATQNFRNSQKVFPARTNFNSQVVLSARDARLEGILQAPGLLIRVGGDLVLGSANPYYIPKAEPIRDLLQKTLNGRLIYMPAHLKPLLESVTQPKIYFKFQPRFWHDAERCQDFYRAISDNVVVYDKALKTFTKPKMLGALFSLSPELLLETVREACHQVLMRGYFQFGQALDLACLQALHQNTGDYLRSLSLLPMEGAPQALVSHLEPAFKMAPKPMLYYVALVNDQGLEEFVPKLYIPEALINEVRSQQGGLVQTELLSIVPEHFTSKEWLREVEGQPAVKRLLIHFFENNPKAEREINETALVAKTRLAALALPSAKFSNVTLKSGVKTQKLAVLIEGKLTIHADIRVKEEALLASLFEDVEIRSLVERRYGGNAENFQEEMFQAMLCAKEILLYAGKNAVFVGAKTSAEVNTRVVALANILDLPLPLVQRQVSHFYSKRRSGTIVQESVIQQVSQHRAGEAIEFVAGGSAGFQGTRLDTKACRVEGRTVQVIEAHNQYSRSETMSGKKRGLFGNKTEQRSCQEVAVQSVGSHLNLDSFSAFGWAGIMFQGAKSSAAVNTFHAPHGEVRIAAATDHYCRQETVSKKDAFWQSRKSQTLVEKRYKNAGFAGKVVVHAERLSIEGSGAAPLWVQRLESECAWHYQRLLEISDVQRQHKQGPGPALAGLVAVAVTIASHGTCSGWAASLLGCTEALAAGTLTANMALAHTMVSAGLGSLIGQSTSALVMNQGNLGQTLKSLARSDTVKGLATA